MLAEYFAKLAGYFARSGAFMLAEYVLYKIGGLYIC